MIDELEKKDCCGCTACASICPRQCITMEKDNEGFIYPNININVCIKCQACENVCPILRDRHSFKEKLPETFVVRDHRKSVLNNSTSGGVFTSVMEFILDNAGVIYGVIIDEDNVVKHIRVTSKSDRNIEKIPCSKYVRSEIRGIFNIIKTDLMDGKIVCFSGTPCQVAGLKCFLGKEYENLITIDVICRGNPSPLFWEKFVEYQENKYNSKIIDVKFRNKTYGYHSGTMKLIFENGKKYFASARTNIFLKSFFSDLCSRPSCYDCKFKHINHVSDLTLYDSWHASELAGIQDDDQGFTNVIVQSQKGKNLLYKLHKLEKYSVDTLKAIELDGVMVENSISWSKNREKFFQGINEENIKDHCLKFFKISVKDYIIEKAKKFYYFRKFFG